MKLGFEESQATYTSEPQNARALSEYWVQTTAFCPNCANPRLSRFPNNKPVADFYCLHCSEQFELKSQKGRIGPRIVDGAYQSMMTRLRANDNPNLFVLNYSRATGVSNFIVIPKHFFVPEIIEKRKPLATTARRAGWIGCNILFRDIPETGKIFVIRDGVPQSPESVREQWRHSLFLRSQGLASRGWLLTVMRCIEAIDKQEFTLADVYFFETHVSEIFPANRHVREKMRQQLQFLRNAGYLSFLGSGRYRLNPKNRF